MSFYWMAMTQKTVLQITQTLCAELGAPIPSAAITSTDANVQMLLSFIRATCDDLLREHNWNQLITPYSFSTVSGTESYAWPADYFHGIEGTMWDTSNRWPIRPTTPVQWQILTTWNVTSSPFERLFIMQNKMNFFPVPAATYNFKFLYISSYYAKSSGGVLQSDFLADSDTCLFDARLVTYGAKLKWFAQKKTDTTAALTDYTRALEFAKAQDKVAPRLSLLPPITKYISTQNYPDGNWVTTAP